MLSSMPDCCRRLAASCALAVLAAPAVPMLGLATARADSVDAETQSITVSITQEPPQLNSTKATDQVSLLVLGHVMEGLLRYDRRGRIAPGVAEEWEIRELGATFRLRETARWSDGEPVTARDFVYAWQTVLEPKNASEYAFVLYPIKNAPAINRGELPVGELGVKAVDDRTLEVRFERPVGYFDKLTAFGVLYPVREDFHRARGELYGSEAEHLLYNGAFTLTDWVHSASLKMEKNPHYWNRDAVSLNVIDVAYITADTNARLNLFKDDKIAFTQLNAETLDEALKQGYRIRKFTTGSVFFLEFNHREGRLTQNLNLRRAFQHIFDPEEMVNKVLATPGNLPGYSLFPVWVEGVEGKFREEYPVRRITPDAGKAKEYLKKAQAELGLAEMPPLVLLVSDSPTATRQAEYVQGVVKNRLGLELRIDIQTFKQRLAKMTSGEFDLVAAGWGPDFDDALTFGDLFASWNLNNRGRYKNPEYDRLVRVAMNSSAPRVRMDAFGRLQEILVEDAVVIPQYEQGLVYVQHPRLRGLLRQVVGHDPDYTWARVLP